MEAIAWTLIAMFGATVFGQFALINGIRKELAHIGERMGRIELRLEQVDEWRKEVDGWRRDLTDRVVALER